jgi:transcriptional regulator with XRE-family HTH domain
MKTSPKNLIGDLRRQRKMTLEQLANAVGTGKAQILKLENGTRRLTQGWMERLAPALGVHSAALLPGGVERQKQLDPSEMALLKIIGQLSPQDRAAFIGAARGLAKKLQNKSKAASSKPQRSKAPRARKSRSTEL